MATDLIVYGPYEVPFDDSGASKYIDTPQKKQFLQLIKDEGLSEKQGCYVFALRAGKGHKPWYIGKATKTIRQECAGQHQLQHYNAVLSKGKKGTPVMFLVLPRDGLKKVPKNICDEMESVLIQSALIKNPEIRNVQKAKVPEWGIDGVLRGKKGQPTKRASTFRKMLGL